MSCKFSTWQRNTWYPHSPILKCTEYLQEHLEASNVFSVLPQAQKFEDKDLEERCWEVIETQTENALMSEGFVTLERSVVESVVKRERLNVKEVELFKAVDHWATKEVERQRHIPDGVVKRRILGEEIVKAIRFPVMSQKEFASVLDCDILTKEEIVLMMKHYSGFGLESSLPFMNAIRTVLLHRVYRFEKPGGTDLSWGYSGQPDAINLTVSKPVMLHGVQHFGSEGGIYTVSLEVRRKDGAIGDSQARIPPRKMRQMVTMDLMSCLITQFPLRGAKLMRLYHLLRARHHGV